MSRSVVKSFILAAGALFVAVAVAAGCGGSDDGGGGLKIALLLPENQTPRYESADRPYFEEKVEELCPECEVIYSNAGEDARSSRARSKRR